MVRGYKLKKGESRETRDKCKEYENKLDDLFEQYYDSVIGNDCQTTMTLRELRLLAQGWLEIYNQTKNCGQNVRNHVYDIGQELADEFKVDVELDSDYPEGRKNIRNVLHSEAQKLERQEMKESARSRSRSRSSRRRNSRNRSYRQ